MGCKKLQYESKLTLHRGGKSEVDTSLNLSRLPQKSRVDTGYYYYGARYYNPKISNWLSVDPMAEEAYLDGEPNDGFFNSMNLNPYNYVSRNPVNYIDPTGMYDEKTGKVEKGDNLTRITKEINQNSGKDYTIDQIAKANGIKDANKIDVGQTILAPSNSNIKEDAKNKNTNSNLNIESLIASKFKNDKRIYSMSNKSGTVDCSRFTQEVASEAGYNLPRTAFEQANWYKRNGTFSNDLNDAQAGDHVFWKRGKDAYHTGIVLSAGGTSSIKVIQAQVNKYRPGSIKVQGLLPNGEMRGFNQPFIGVGRYRKK